jgi:DNA-binding MarR family transcriptional regulator
MDVSTKHDFRSTQTMRLLRALVEANGCVMKLDEIQIRTYGLASAEFDGLVTLGVDQPLRMCDLAQRSLLTKSHTTQVVKQLEAKGLVNRQRSRESEREVLVSLTPEGQELFERVYPLHYEFLKGLFQERLSGAEQEALIALLRKLTHEE